MAAAAASITTRLSDLALKDVPDDVLTSGVLDNPVVFGYTFESGIDPKSIPWGSLTHLVLAFFNVDPAGTVAPSSSSPQTLVDAAHKNGVKVIASIGGSGSGSTSLAVALSSNATSAALVASLVSNVKNYGLDGVDFDFEFPETTQQVQNLFVALNSTRSALGAAFGSGNKTLTMTLYSSKGQFGPNVPQMDARPFSSIVDYGLLMSYDYFGSFSAISAPNSPFYDVPGYPGLSFTSSIAAWLKSGWDAEKLVAGLPYYGRTTSVQARAAPGIQFMPSSGATPPGGPINKISGAWTWTDLRDPAGGALSSPTVAQGGWQRYWDNTTMTPWLFHNTSLTYIGYDDLDSLAIKANHIITNGLVGVMVWMVQYDYDSELNMVVSNYTAACERIVQQLDASSESSLSPSSLLPEESSSEPEDDGLDSSRSSHESSTKHSAASSHCKSFSWSCKLQLALAALLSMSALVFC
ncbi:hypothetical protein GGI04_000287 [Coemansia thaxteri]|uniref:GH18 domain-containing protein n=1 Tax=Coemansia thaxteri TaxID=2663907 RepID=A0A9W8EHC1_9FUNG|nr:hypothetical protein H4R26_004671 [Coemansia thaxteri]KAJ2009635.1 hypothetical protein GGI04_000287 [Coemansia thaxteri]